MSFPFEKVPYRVYANTFLHDVSLDTEFDDYRGEVTPGLRDRLWKFFESIVGGNLAVNQESEDGELRLSSEQREVEMTFGGSSCAVKLRFPTYTSISDLWDWLPYLIQYLQILDIREIRNIKLTKFNELTFSLENSSATVIDAMESLYSSSLLNHSEGWGSIKGKLQTELDTLTRWQRREKLEETAAHLAAKIVYGFNLDEDISAKGKLVLKIIMESDALARIPFSEPGFRETVNEMNIWCDAAFHWSLTPKMIQTLQ